MERRKKWRGRGGGRKKRKKGGGDERKKKGRRTVYTCEFDLIDCILLSMSSAERKAVIKHADMNEEMQQDAIDCANVALEKFNIEKDIAAYIKKEFDKKYNPTWHCVVGRNFGSYVTHETKHFIYFYMGQVAVLLFKSG